MSFSFPMDSFSKSKTIDPSCVLKIHKLKRKLKYTEKKGNPNSTQKQLAKTICCSDSTIERSRKQISMNNL